MLQCTADELNRMLVQRFRESATTLDHGAVARFCKVTRTTVAGWLAGGKPLGGLYIIRLWHLLEVGDVASPELKQARKDYPLGEYIGRLMAFDLLSAEDARAMAGVKKDTAIFSAARTEAKLLRCSRSIESLKAEYDELLMLAREELRKELITSYSSDVVPTQTALSSDSQVTSTAQVDKERVFSVSQQLLAARSSAAYAVDDFSQEERALLRTYMGERGMFDLSNFTSRLCTERAFQEGGSS